MSFKRVRPVAATALAFCVLAALAGPRAMADPKPLPPAKQATVSVDTPSPPGIDQPTRDAIIKRGSGLPVPRFASLRSDEVNVRSGPGTRYPIEWVFQRKNMPVEVVAEFDTWRKIRDWQGTSGWVHQSMLVGKRTIVVAGRQVSLRRTPESDSQVVAKVETSVQGELMSCKGSWCRVRIADYKGWIQRSDMWGIYPDEKIE
jgi:SH3-like domain-containing protein